MSTLYDIVKPFTSEQKRWLSGKERNAVRAAFRKALKAGKLEVRTVYYDYYDSCHPPTETPDAQWNAVNNTDQYNLNFWLQRLKSGPHTPSVVALPDGTWELVTGYSTYNVRVVA